MGHQARLRSESFEDVVYRRGHPVVWQQAMKCTCWSEDSGQPDYNCDVCDYNGYIYLPPIKSRYVLVLSLIWQRDFTPVGEHRLGDAVATVPYYKKFRDEDNRFQKEFNELYHIGEWDLIVLQDSEFRSQELLRRGEAIYKRSPDTLRNKHAVKVKNVFTVESGEIINFEEGIDFKLEGNEINWFSGCGPAEGQRYSVVYFHNPVYVVHTSLPQSRDYDDQHMPKKAVLRYMDVL